MICVKRYVYSYLVGIQSRGAAVTLLAPRGKMRKILNIKRLKELIKAHVINIVFSV